MKSLKSYLAWIQAKLGINTAVVYTFYARSWPFVAGPITALIMASYLAPALQGYYYTFLSLVALQAFAELGFYNVIMQFASHEWARLSFDRQRGVYGDTASQSRLASILRFVLHWYVTAGGAFLVLVGIFGYVFLSHRGATAVSWKMPWCLFLALSAVQLMVLPLLTILEGCNQFAEVSRMRLASGIFSNLGFWIAMALGWNLWSACVLSGIQCGVQLYFLVRPYGLFFKSLLHQQVSAPFSWRTEMLPMQWRLASQGIVSYFAFNLFTPVLFWYRGAVVAGQMGMTWQAVSALGALGLVWIQTRVPSFGMLIAKREYDRLDQLFFHSCRVTIFVTSLASLGLWLTILFLNTIHHRLATRVLPPMPFGLFLIAMLLAQVTQCEAAYLRAHKREPFLYLGISSSVLIGLLVWRLGKNWGAPGCALGYLIPNALVSLPVATFLWFRLRRRWHLAPEDSVTP